MNYVTTDHQAMLWMREHRHPRLVPFFRVLTYSAVGRVWFLAAALIWVSTSQGVQLFGTQYHVLRALLAPLAAWIIGQIIKVAVGRQRPFQCIPGYTALVVAPLNDSFPSSHTSSTIAFFFALLISNHPAAPWVGLWAIPVSFSRFYLGVHFPSDILGGAILGVACGTSVAYFLI